jgi:DNA-binding transcriptional MerR regulator
MFSIGDLSRRTGVKVPTIRYYEQMGLIAPAGRTEGNQRRYDRDGLERLSFIRHARDLGLSIEAIRELAELSAHPEEPCADAHRIAREHRAEIHARIERLRRLEAELGRIEQMCDADRVGECRIIEALADHGLCSEEH